MTTAAGAPLTARLLIIGAISLLGQAVVLRELAVSYYGNELIYALALGGWLLGTAAGAACGGGRAPRDARVRRWLVTFGLALLAVIALARGVRVLLGAVPGAYLPFGLQILGLACCVLPPSVVTGVLFREAARVLALRGGSFAVAYAWESAGAVVGGALATGLLAAGVDNLAAGLLCALGAVAGGARLPSRDAKLATAGTALAAAALIGALAASAFIDRAMTAWSHPLLVATRDTPYGRVTVTESSGQIAVYQNDALAYDSEGSDAEEFVHLAAIQRERPESVLVLGGALPGLLPEVLFHRPEKVADVEVDRAVVDMVSSRRPESAPKVLADPRVRVVLGDPRRVLERSAPIDLILVAMPEPDSGGANRYYTREFFESCARKLGARGVLAFRLRGAENVWTPLATRRAASIGRALHAAFADVVVLPGATQVFLASAAPLDRDPEVLGARLRSRGPGPRLVTPAYVRYLYTNDRFAETAARLARSDAPINSDRRPECYATTMLLGLSRFFPGLGSAGLPDGSAKALARSPGTWLALAVAAAVVWLARRRETARRAVLAGLAGGAGMVLECALLLGHQTRSGVLYRDLGLLMTAFMAGLAVGAGTSARSSATTTRRAVTVAAFAALALGSAEWLRAGSPGGLAVCSALLFALGCLVAALVAHAASAGRPDPVGVVSPVYAADVLGGCVGSLLAGLVLIPFAGLPATAVAAAVAIAAAWML